MKIYQIHETSGSYEDYYDYIVGTYLHKDRAELEMQKLVNTEETRQKRYEKCQNCPIGDLDLQEDTFETMKDACNGYCNRSQIYEELYGFGCENEESYWDDKNYKIKEIKVIE